MRSESQHSACVYVAMRLDFTCDVRELRARTEVARGVVARSAVVRFPVRVCVDRARFIVSATHVRSRRVCRAQIARLYAFYLVESNRCNTRQKNRKLGHVYKRTRGARVTGVGGRVATSLVQTFLSHVRLDAIGQAGVDFRGAVSARDRLSHLA